MARTAVGPAVPGAGENRGDRQRSLPGLLLLWWGCGLCRIPR